MRSSFSSSPLVRTLDAWTPAEPEPSGLDFAERLSLWVNAFDAIRLQAAHQQVASLRSAPAPRPAVSAARQAKALADDVQRVRGVLARAIAQDPDPLAASPAALVDPRRLVRTPAQPTQGAAAADPGYAPWRQRHQELQRQMDLMIPPLRDHVRQALAQGSPRLRQLAILDAAMEQVLAPREQALLPGVGVRLERRFKQLRAQHMDAAEPATEDAAAAARRPGGWLDLFGKDWRQLLLAELDLRLQPVTGMLEALARELDERQ